MPARPLVADVCQVLIKGQFGAAENWLNKLFISYAAGVPAAGDLANYADNLYAIIAADMPALMPAATTVTEVEVTDLATAVGAVGISGGSTIGTRAGVELPASCSVLVSYHVARHYRGGHPRSYMPLGVGADLLTQATWTGAFLADVSTYLLALRNQLLAPSGAFTPTEIVNVSYYGGAPPVGGHSVARVAPVVDVIPTTAFTVSAKVATQRRRLGR
jgi:hypothetical protein